ncbi:S-adenosyl-L-methionine-dependent methyltransferase [Marasmius fiardii PR-910]|nr:S-adenosyl-L-methionine-dependent methyltransferase [Marasmius fiardii PR-910]
MIILRIGKALFDAYPWDEEETTVLDYACGTGLNSRQLLPYVRSITGVDISQAMVDRYNDRTDKQGISPEEMKAIRIELQGKPGELDGSTFDVAMCCMSYHHFVNPTQITKTLAYFLKPGGSVFVADIESTPNRDEILPQSANHVVVHKHGFSQEEMQSFFDNAGLTSFQFTRITRAKKNDRDVNVFLARGIK